MADEDDSPSTGKIERAVAHALHIFGILDIRHNVEQAAKDARRAWITAQKIEKRQLRSLSAASTAYQMEVKEEE